MKLGLIATEEFEFHYRQWRKNNYRITIHKTTLGLATVDG